MDTERIESTLRAIVADDYDALVALGGPVEHRGDKYVKDADFRIDPTWGGGYEDEARYLFPARFQAIRQAAEAALDAVE